MPAGGGWFAVYRSVFEGRFGPSEESPGCEAIAWLWILSRARFERDGDLARGEVRVSSRGLAEAMYWHRSRAQRFIASLVKNGELSRATNRATNRATLPAAFTVVNYERLQPGQGAREPLTEPPTEPLVRSKERKKKEVPTKHRSAESGAALVSGVVEKLGVSHSRPARGKSHSLAEQRAYLADEIRKGEGD